MVQVHPYKVRGEAPILSLQGREHPGCESHAAQNPGKQANFTSLLPALEMDQDQSQDRVFGPPPATSHRYSFPRDNPAAVSAPVSTSAFFC